MNSDKEQGEQYYKWVKASDELPELYDNHERHFQVDGSKAQGMFDLYYGEKTFEHKTYHGYVRLFESEFQRIEWLKPVDGQQSQQPEIPEQEAIDGNTDAVTKENIEVFVTGIVQKQSDAVEFAEWICENNLHHIDEGSKWFAIEKKEFPKAYYKGVELYKLFKNKP